MTATVNTKLRKAGQYEVSVVTKIKNHRTW